MKKCLLTVLFFVAFGHVQGQGAALYSEDGPARRKSIDSLQCLLLGQKTDTGKARILRFLGISYRSIHKDSSIRSLEQALALSKKANDIKGKIATTRIMVDFLAQSGDYKRALEVALESLQFAEDSRDTMSMFWATRAVWRSYSYMLEHSMVLLYAKKAKSIVHSGYFTKKEDIHRYALVGYINAMALAYDGLRQMDSAIHYGQLAYNTALWLKDNEGLAIATHNLGDFYRKIHDYKAAFAFYRATIPLAKKTYRNDLIASSHLGIGRLYEIHKRNDSALYYGKLAFEFYRNDKSPVHELLATTFLSNIYAKEHRTDSAYKYQTLILGLKDSLFNEEKTREVQKLAFNEELRRKELERQKHEAQERYSDQLKTYGIVSGLVICMLIIFFLYRLRQVKHETELKATFNNKINHIEMRALRAQMNPHFIFNCLNSINRYIVKSNHKTASNYLTKFAKLIRLILDNSANEYITLDKEVQTLQLYIEMEKLRFDNICNYQIEVDEQITPENILIPSMLLQPYVENAIWHGLLHKETGNGELRIRLRQPRANTLIAEVEDNGVGRDKAMELKSKNIIKNKSYGMQISKDRIFLINELYNMKASVSVEDLIDDQGEARGTKVTVQIPVKTL